MAHDFSPLAGGLRPGDRVASYQVEEQIGHGGMAIVYRALDLRLGRQVALKVLAPNLGEDEAFRQRFIRESRAAATVDHPHIIPVFEAGGSGDLLFIAMRYCSGGDVRALIETEGPLSLRRTAEITAQVASALDAAHAHGLVHRDVKPGNVLLADTRSTGADHVYLSDFGLSKYSLAASTLTQTGQFMGTLDYVSPEQIQGQPADGRADQYALACTVAEMLSGLPPFQRDESMALLWAKLEAAPPPLSQRRPDLPPAIDNVIGTALAKSPADRYPSCLAFAAALRAACEVGPVTLRATDITAAPPVAQVAPMRAELPAGQIAQTQADAVAVLAGPKPEAMAAPPRTPAQDHVVSPAGLDGRRVFAEPGLAPGPGSGSPPPPSPRRHTAPLWRDEHLVPQRQPLPRRRRKGGLVAALLAVLVIAGLGGLGYKLLYHPARSIPPAPGRSSSPTASPLSPQQVVQAYINAINAGNYAEAWNLVGRRKSYNTFAAGFAGTEQDTLTIESVSGNVVTAELAALQTNGHTKYFSGTYTVTGGVISHSNVVCLSGCSAKQ